MVFAGNDPSGGAGLCADIQTLTHMGCQALPVVTCVTVQDTQNVQASFPLTGEQVSAQAETVLKDMPVTLCKIGLLGSLDIVEAVQQILLNYSMPVVFDPILVAGGGYPLAQAEIHTAMINRLLPLTYVLTPNSQEARRLSGKTDLESAAHWLMDKGCQYVCITGTHEVETPTVIHTLYGQNQLLSSWSWSRLAGSFHGSGCTLAASLAGFLAQGKAVTEALYAAQHYTWTSLQRGFYPGQGQALPNRLTVDYQHSEASTD